MGWEREGEMRKSIIFVVDIRYIAAGYVVYIWSFDRLSYTNSYKLSLESSLVAEFSC